MVNKYSITIYNEFSSPVAFDLFQAPPDAGTGPQVFTNIYQAGDEISPGQGTTKFNITDQFFGVTGVAPQGLNPNVTVQANESLPVTLATTSTQGTSLYLTTYPDGSPYFDQTKTTQDVTTHGAYRIVTDKTINPTDEKHPFLGLGCADPNDANEGLPTAVIQGQATQQYLITPKIKFWICEGSYTSGEIIDVTTIGESQEVDFSSGTADQIFTYNSDGIFVSGPPSGK